MKRIFLLLVAVCAIWPATAQQNMTVMFYNTENLFDPTDDPEKNDDDFTPQGSYRWTEKRYHDKLDAVGKVIAAAGNDLCPALVGLCEVENNRVLEDMTEHSVLKNAGYRYVMTDSPDKRGIDVALLYRRTDFRLISYGSIRIRLNGNGSKPTRDVLHVTGRIASGDTLDIYVCHWPSRIGGEKDTEHLRMTAAKTVKASVDSVVMARRKPYVIIMGDLNEGPESPAVISGLKAAPFVQGAELDDGCLVTVMDAVSQGSYRYDGYWDCYDQFVVSASVLNGLGCVEFESVKVMDEPFLLEDDDKYGGMKPWRTFNGRRYQGGFSDHLPILMTVSY